jgi:hypothetical protein
VRYFLAGVALLFSFAAGEVGAIGWLIAAGLWFATYRSFAGHLATVRRRDADYVEGLALARLAEFPHASDAEIAQLVRDDLHNRRLATASMLSFAVPETAGRVRRTVVREAMRSRRAFGG